MRDVLAHFDEYELGTGRLQKPGKAGEPIRLSAGERTMPWCGCCL
jgi:hypothetical protein